MPRENAACAFKAKMRLRHSRCDAQERLSARGNPTERKRRNSSRVCLARASHSRSRRRRRRAREGGQDREESARSQSLPRRRVPDPTERWCLGHSPSQRRVVEWLHRTPRGGDARTPGRRRSVGRSDGRSVGRSVGRGLKKGTEAWTDETARS